MSSKRPPITEVLDIRSHETVYVICESSDISYPQGWIAVEQGSSMPKLDFDAVGQPEAVVIIDRIDVLRRELIELLQHGPRILGAVVADVEQEKRFRRNLRTLYPWAEVWETHTDFGKVLMTCAFGRPYDREQVIDARPQVSA